MHLLEAVVNDAFLHEADHAVGHGFRVQAQVLVVLDTVKNGIWDASDANLQASTIRNLGCHMGADSRFFRCRVAEDHAHGGFLAVHGGRQLGFVDEALPVEVGDVGAHLRNHHAGALYGRYGNIGRYAEAAIAILVGQGAVDHGYVHGDFAAAEKPRHFTQESGRHGAVAGGHVLTLVRGNEDAVDEEGFLVFGLAERGWAAGDVESGDYLHATKFLVAAGQCGLQDNGDGGAALENDGIAAAYQFDGLVCAYVFHELTKFTNSFRCSSRRWKSASLRRRDTHTRMPHWPLPVVLSGMATTPQRNKASSSSRFCMSL